MVPERSHAGHCRLSRLDDAGLRCRLRSALTHLRVRSLAVLPGAFPASPSRDERSRVRAVIDPPTALEVLRGGDIQLVGRLIGRRTAMLARVTGLPAIDPPQTIEAVYKPTTGRRPWTTSTGR
jgi:hypothetical protein